MESPDRDLLGPAQSHDDRQKGTEGSSAHWSSFQNGLFTIFSVSLQERSDPVRTAMSWAAATSSLPMAAQLFWELQTHCGFNYMDCSEIGSLFCFTDHSLEESFSIFFSDMSKQADKWMWFTETTQPMSGVKVLFFFFYLTSQNCETC